MHPYLYQKHSKGRLTMSVFLLLSVLLWLLTTFYQQTNAQGSSRAARSAVSLRGSMPCFEGGYPEPVAPVIISSDDAANSITFRKSMTFTAPHQRRFLTI